MTKQHHDEEPKEIKSFNYELVTFDGRDLEVEELERRFELAVGAVPTGGICGDLQCSDMSCENLACASFTDK